MHFAPSPRATDLVDAVSEFVAREIEPIEDGYHRQLAQVRCIFSS